MKLLKLFILLLFNICYSASFSQTFNYTIKQNIVKISECDNPKNGFVLTGKTITKTANNDYFLLDTGKTIFMWNDNKGLSNHKIYNFQSKTSNINVQCVFFTEHNLIRITSNQQNEAVIEIVCQINNQWNCLSYLCDVRKE
ncbi:MAG: hypothetical protein GZ094_21235 [Mariniphaga sp.]|nr:hypothetical protein [Mariniphaga sp.]